MNQFRQHARSVSIEQSNSFKDLDRKVQVLIEAVAGDQDPVAALKELIQSENASYKQHVSQEVEKVGFFGDTFPWWLDTSSRETLAGQTKLHFTSSLCGCLCLRLEERALILCSL